VDFSLWLSTAQPWPDLLHGAQWAEAHDWHGVWVPDHFMTNVALGEPSDAELAPWLEAWTTQSALAALVPRVRIGAMVSGNLYRHPAVVANMAGTVDAISGGRLVLGLGAGWQENEHARYGIALGSLRERSDRLEEASAAITSLLRRPRTTFTGEHYVLDGAPCEPSGGDRPIPLLIGGKGERRTLRTVALHADEWNMWALPGEVAAKRGVLARWCEEFERDPAEIRVTIATMAWICENSAEADEMRAALGSRGGMIGASTEELREAAAAYAEAGVDEIVLADFNLPTGAREDVLGRLQVEVLDEFR
jgi:alkanesulfonate monooxygenase SsuD/methylene tetrahydromethanopterin reductase-like flavin-dependent oxidoreductase (luciferase family)